MEEHAEHTSEIDSLESALRTNFDHLRQKQHARLEQLSSLMASLSDCPQAATDENESLNSIADGTLGSLQSIKENLSNPVEKQQELESKIAELESTVENSEREKAGLAEKVHTADANLQELKSLRETLSARTEELEALKQSHQELSQNYENMTGELQSARERAQEAETRLAEKEADGQGNADHAQELEARIASLEEELAARDNALQEANDTLQRAQEDQQRVASEFEVLTETLKQSEATQEGLKTELIAVQRELEALRGKYKEGLSTDAALALRQQVSETAEQVKRLEGELETAKNQSKKSSLALQLAEAIGETEDANEELQRLRQELSFLRDGKAYQAPAPKSASAPLDLPSDSTLVRSPDADLARIHESAKGGSHGPKRVIGQILFDAGIISGDQLQQSLELQKSNPQQHLGAILTELGFASDEAVAQARASQCGVEFIRFTDETVDPNAASLITERLAHQHSCIPISTSDLSMVLAITNPMDLLAIEDVERFTNKKVDVVVGTVPEIEAAITRYYWEPE